jgi:hypothetical protein
MGRPKKDRPSLSAIWTAPDALWEIIEPILDEHDPAKPPSTQSSSDCARAVNGIISQRNTQMTPRSIAPSSAE